MRAILAITPGDPEGIGPEVALKALADPASVRRMSEGYLPLLFGAEAPLHHALKNKVPLSVVPESLLADARRPELRTHLLEAIKSGQLPLVAAPIVAPAPAPSGASLPGYQSGWAIEKAARFVLSEPHSALVTGPIDKKRLNDAGYKHPGHTEFLAELCGVKSVTMMLSNEKLRVSLVTIHTPLSRVSSLLTEQALTRAILHTAEHLTENLGLTNPTIAVMGLNPHAGEKGLLGSEEDTIIAPTLRKLQGSRFTLTGPHPADTFFALHAMGEKKADAVVCMYHDQGLIPVKLVDFKNTVNLTLGLPMIRTSVDHGVAFDLAGQNRADPSSFIAALRLAETLTDHRRKRIAS